MFNELNQQLEDSQQGALYYQKVLSMLEDLENQQKNLTNKMVELKAQLEKEELDVESLEGKSVAHIFYSILGNIDKHLSKERQEALAARLKYDQSVRELEEVKSQINKLILEKDQYRNCESTYKRLYEQKKELLLQSNSDTADRILSLTEQFSLITNHRKEVKEAIGAGSKVISHLDNALKSLDSAHGWGTWDLLGGGLISDLAKHSHIDAAKNEVEQTQLALSRFRTELADVRINSEISIDTNGFAKFADFFFDGLIADWCMQSRIQASQESVANTRNKVNQVVSRLISMEQSEASKLELIEKEINALITQAK